jgi:hypothetical protein
LNFGHRLGLLKQAWEFPVNQKLAGYIGGEKELNHTTVHRWIGEKGGNPRDLAKEEATEGLSTFFSKEGYFARYDVEQSQFVDAMLGDDLKFVNFLAGASKEPLPVPASLQRVDGGKFDALRRKVIGKFLLYRLGVETQRMGRTVIMRGAKNVLRRVPVQIEDGDRYLRYSENYFGNKSKGFVFLIDAFITIWGEDADREGFSELFLSHITLETNRVAGGV